MKKHMKSKKKVIRRDEKHSDEKWMCFSTALAEFVDSKPCESNKENDTVFHPKLNDIRCSY
uniref:Uncharacterized protein n=1 Tax=Romanomermis culicivorax TaxID=13658 RepID=A0A915JXV1_ROMCU